MISFKYKGHYKLNCFYLLLKFSDGFLIQNKSELLFFFFLMENMLQSLSCSTFYVLYIFGQNPLCCFSNMLVSIKSSKQSLFVLLRHSFPRYSDYLFYLFLFPYSSSIISLISFPFILSTNGISKTLFALLHVQHY